jgi:KaiC/GvpD/RAD55 family RecA-like ATPase
LIYSNIKNGENIIQVTWRELRVQVDEHFREEIFKIDEYTEKKLATSIDANENERLNKERDVLIQGVDETKELSMKHLNEVLAEKVSNNQVIDSNTLFKHFCFVITYKNRLRP